MFRAVDEMPALIGLLPLPDNHDQCAADQKAFEPVLGEDVADPHDDPRGYGQLALERLEDVHEDRDDLCQKENGDKGRDDCDGGRIDDGGFHFALQ